MNVQIITQDSQPAFAVISYADYVEMLKKIAEAEARKKSDNLLIPDAVVGMTIEKGYSLIKAWRVHLKKTQSEIAKELGITQGAYSQIENSRSNQKETLSKIAGVLGIAAELLTVDD